MSAKAWNDQTIEIVVSKLLRAGVLLSALVVLSGGCVYLVRHGFEQPEFHVFRGEPSALRTVAGILHSVIRLRGRGIIQLGLLLLIATPVARVAFSILGFAEERDYRYVAFTCVVFAVLIYSLFASA